VRNCFDRGTFQCGVRNAECGVGRKIFNHGFHGFTGMGFEPLNTRSTRKKATELEPRKTRNCLPKAATIMVPKERRPLRDLWSRKGNGIGNHGFHGLTRMGFEPRMTRNCLPKAATIMVPKERRSLRDLWSRKGKRSRESLSNLRNSGAASLGCSGGPRQMLSRLRK
jgi:hypothetical protein